MARVNSSRLPVVFGGDINSWQTDRGRYAPHRVLVSRGFRDAASARKRINSAYPTVNHWRTRVVAASRGSGNRLDVVMVKRGKGFLRYENKVARVDRARPSDHNMVVADVVL
jgi:exonuclease III